MGANSPPSGATGCSHGWSGPTPNPWKTQTAVHRFETVRTAPAMLEDLFRRHRPDRVVIEVGPAAGWITDLAARMKIELQVANPTHQGWRWRGVKNKTDRVDAVKPAQWSSVNQLPQVTLPSKEVRDYGRRGAPPKADYDCQRESGDFMS